MALANYLSHLNSVPPWELLNDGIMHHGFPISFRKQMYSRDQAHGITQTAVRRTPSHLLKKFKGE